MLIIIAIAHNEKKIVSVINVIILEIYALWGLFGLNRTFITLFRVCFWFWWREKRFAWAFGRVWIATCCLRCSWLILLVCRPYQRFDSCQEWKYELEPDPNGYWPNKTRYTNHIVFNSIRVLNIQKIELKGLIISFLDLVSFIRAINT